MRGAPYLVGTEREVFTLGYEEIEKRAAEMDLPVYQYQRVAAQRAMRLTTELNFQYHEPEEVTRLFSKLIGKPVGEGFCLFPPFYMNTSFPDSRTAHSKAVRCPLPVGCPHVCAGKICRKPAHPCSRPPGLSCKKGA